MGVSFSQPQHDVSQLLRAAESGKKKNALRLIAKSPLLVATSAASSGRTVWHAAAQHAHADVISALAAHIQLLWDGQLRESLSWDGDAALASVPESNQLLAYLVNLTDRKGRTPLILACIRGNSQTVEALLSLGANPRIRMRNGKLALHYAAQHGHTRQVLQLLQWWQQQQQRGIESNSAFLDAATSYGVTPLHLAVLRCHPATVKVLVEHGASVTNTCTYPHKGPRWLTHKYDGCTALHLAAATGSKTITCLLLAAHFQGGRLSDEEDPRNIRNYQGRLAVDVALGRGYRRVAEVLDPTAPLSAFMSRRDLGLTPIPTLVQLAGQALQTKLLMELEQVESHLQQEDKAKVGPATPCLDSGAQQDLISTLRSSLQSQDSPFLSPLHSFQQESSMSSSPFSSQDEGTLPSPAMPSPPPHPSSSQWDEDSTQSLLDPAVRRLSSCALQPPAVTQGGPVEADGYSLLDPNSAETQNRWESGAAASSSGGGDTATEAADADVGGRSGVRASKRPRRAGRHRRHGAGPSSAASDPATTLSDQQSLLNGMEWGTAGSESETAAMLDGQQVFESNPSGLQLAGDSDDDGSLDLDDDSCCETGKQQAESTTPSGSNLLTSASHLIGGTLKALRVGHHRSRSANGSQGGNGPLSIIASMAALAPEGGSGRLSNMAEGWSQATLADWTASTSACGNSVHAALLAIQVDDDEDVCEVCMDRPMEVTVVSCQHRMCVECCRSVLKMRDMCAPLCPFCRGQIEGLR